MIFLTDAGRFEACIRKAKMASAKHTPIITETTNNVINLLFYNNVPSDPKYNGFIRHFQV